MKRAEEAFDAASDRFDAAASALDAAREERARARRERYGARQAHEPASTAVDWLQRRVTELSDRLDRMQELPGSRTSCVGHVF
jgi:small-conductance mechanosensitive channel